MFRKFVAPNKGSLDPRLRFMPRLKAVIVGLVRNAEATFESEFRLLSKAFGYHFDLTFLIIESDSQDSTIEILEQHRLLNDKFFYISLGNLDEKIPSRIERIAFCRNTYVQALREMETLSKFDYVIVADLDGVNNCISPLSVASIFIRNDWDMCASNQEPRYYDIYALRKEGWSEGDCFSILNKRVESGENPFKAYKEEVMNKQIRINSKAEWIPVQSAFGGLAIYKSQVFFSSNYSAMLDEQIVCEHVPFHLGMKKNGYKLFINPGLINSCSNNHLNEHRVSRIIRRTILIWIFDLVGPSYFNKFKRQAFRFIKNTNL